MKTNSPFGFDVEVTFEGGDKTMLHNVTEIHYRHKPLADSVAFESDIHHTGTNLPIAKNVNQLAVAEFEAKLATKIHPSFTGESITA